MTEVFVLWLIVVCEWVGGVLLVMGCCVGCAWHVVLSLFYLRAFQMKPVCVVTSD